MTVKIQKAIKFKNICNCKVDYKELVRAVNFLGGKDGKN